LWPQWFAETRSILRQLRYNKSTYMYMSFFVMTHKKSQVHGHESIKSLYVDLVTNLSSFKFFSSNNILQMFTGT